MIKWLPVRDHRDAALIRRPRGLLVREEVCYQADFMIDVSLMTALQAADVSTEP